MSDTNEHLPRAMRNNNPLNLRPLTDGEEWKGESGTDPDHYVMFETEELGWRAAAMNLAEYKMKHQINTVEGVINRWAPEADHNDPAAYIEAVYENAGFTRGEKIDLLDPDTNGRLCAAMAIVEAGHACVWDSAARTRGIADALSEFASPKGA